MLVRYTLELIREPNDLSTPGPVRVDFDSYGRTESAKLEGGEARAYTARLTRDGRFDLVVMGPLWSLSARGG